MSNERGHPVGLPSAHRLRSALRVARMISQTGTAREEARNSYRLVPTGGIYRYDDLVDGEGLLIASGLLEDSAGVLTPVGDLTAFALVPAREGSEALLLELIGQTRPLWLIAAAGEDQFADELVPDADRRILEEVLDPDSREQLLLALGRRYSDQELHHTGALAEEHLVAVCRSELEGLERTDLAQGVQRVSLASDQLGYDVTAPRLDGSVRRLECKGTRGSGARIAFHLSRNEAERGLRDPDWSLVVCRVFEDQSAAIAGYLVGSDVAPLLPKDPLPQARWESVRIDLHQASLRPGIPPAH